MARKKYPPLTRQEVIDILHARGFTLKRRGKHDTYAGNWGDRPRIVQVPGTDLDDEKLIRTIIWQSGMTREDFYASTPRTARKIGLKG